MRLTVHLPENTEKNLKNYAANHHKSVSSIVAESIDFYIQQQKRTRAVQTVRDMIGTAKVKKDALDDLHSARVTDDRA
jgi:hypothetical protein